MDYPKVTLIITTGRRYELFEQTVKSLRENCLDFDLIEETIIIDDKSDKKDLQKMNNILNRLGFLKVSIIENKKHGQLNSLKLGFNNSKTKYTFNCEDDWLFIKKDNFIRKAFDIINSDIRIKQCILRFWECIYIKDKDIEYRMHVYSPLDYKKDWDIIKRNDCTYWGLSFNPGIVETNIVKKCLLGVTQDSPENRGWDKIVSKKYWEFGFKRANLNDEYIYHIGNRLTYYTRNI